MSEPTLPYATPAHHSEHISGRSVFGVVVRTTGLMVVLYGVHSFLTPIYVGAGLTYRGDGLMPENYAIEGAIASVLGVLLIRGGWLVRLAYGRND